jgi:hypothetical protein
LAHARLLVDIFLMKMFVGILGRNGELLDSHLFFYDKYSELADFHRQNGRIAKSDRLAAIAEAHFEAAPDDEPPTEAAAMAMPVPRPMTSTDAVRQTREEVDRSVSVACWLEIASGAEAPSFLRSSAPLRPVYRVA